MGSRVFSAVEIPDPHRWLVIETTVRDDGGPASRVFAECAEEEDADLVLMALWSYVGPRARASVG